MRARLHYQPHNTSLPTLIYLPALLTDCFLSTRLSEQLLSRGMRFERGSGPMSEWGRGHAEAGVWKEDYCSWEQWLAPSRQAGAGQAAGACDKAVTGLASS